MNFSKLDMFSTQFTFNLVNLNSKKGTFLGTLLTIIVVFTALIYLIYFLQQCFHNNIDPNYRSQNAISSSLIDIEFNNEFLGFIFEYDLNKGIESLQAQKNLTYIVYMVAYQINNGVNQKNISLDIIECENEQFHFSSIQINMYVCLDLDELKTTIPDNCATQAEIDQIINGYNAGQRLLLSSSLYEVTSQKFLTSYRNIFVYSIGNQYVYTTVETQKQSTTIKQGLFIQSEQTFSSPIQYGISNQNFDKQYSIQTCGKRPYNQFNIVIDEIIQQIKIEYQTIPQVLAMNLHQKRVYNIQIGNKLPNATHVMRNPKSIDQLLYQPMSHIHNLQDLINEGLYKYSKMEFIGSKNLNTGVYEYETYENIYKKARALGSSLQNQDLLKVSREQKTFRVYSNQNQDFDGTIKMVGIYCKNRPEWTVSDMANALYGYTMVPIYDTLGPDSVSFVLGHSLITTCICSAQSIETLSKTKQLFDLKNIISIEDNYSQESKELLTKRGIRIISFNDIIALGINNDVPLPKNIPTDTIFTFSYTSGTTGNPKGVMLTHRNLLSVVQSKQNGDHKFDETDTHLSYLPLPHIFERFIHVICWLSGTKIAYYSGDILKLREDFAAAKPTAAIFVPRLLNKIYEDINNFINNQPQPQKDYIQKAINEKLKNIYSEQNPTVFHPTYDKQIFKKFNEMFGGKIKSIGSGSAPLSQKVIDFFKVVFSANFNQGYGQTEGTGLETNQAHGDNVENNVGGIVTGIELKLEDVPDMGYLSTDKDELGNSMPRGEICVRGHSVFAGYYKDEEKTLEAIDTEGWLHSGDIGIILPNGALRIIDRKKNIMKLQQGEYISPEKVENIYIRARGVSEAYIHGDSMQAYCVGIIVPNPDEIVKIAKELNISETSIEVLCKNKLINDVYLKIIQEFGKTEGLLSFEQAQKIHIEPVSLAFKGCLTQSFKLQRHIAKQVFKQIFDQMYSTPLPPKQQSRL
ncbi:hypothetical protein ABPG72_022691 [Tetrahymena utriculariae]